MGNGLFNTNDISGWMMQIELLFSAIYFIFVIIMMVIQKNRSRKQMYMYGIVFSIATLLFFDVLVTSCYGISGILVRGIEILGNMLYYFSNYTALWLVICYARELIRDGKGEIPKKLFLGGMAAYAGSGLMMILNIFFPQIYYIDGNNVYQRGSLFFMALVPVGLMLIFLLAVMVTGRKYLTLSEHLTIAGYIGFPLVAEVFQLMESDFAWQPLAMAFFAFIIIIQNVLGIDGKQSKEYGINREGKALQARIILFVCFVIVAFFSIIARIAIGFASTQMNQEIEARYQMLANKTTEQASAWIVKETQILLNQKAGLEIINNFDHEFLTEYFTYIVEDYNYDHYVYDMYFVNTKNQMSSGSGYIQDPSIDFRERDWYAGALSSDNMCYTVPYVDVDTGKYVVTVSIKVFDRNRRFRGVLALDIFVEKLFDITDQQSLPKESYLFIVDNELGLVTHPNEEFGYYNEEPRKIRELGVDGYNQLADFIQTVQDENACISFRDYDGISRCFFVSKVEDCDWYVVAAISQKVIDESRSNMSRSIFIALIVCLILGIILSLWATNSIIRKLTEAQEEARAASEAKSRFLANMSHEIRTPINAVLGMDAILLRECKDESLREYAENIQSAGQALLGVVNDILDFSKIESDRLDLVPGKYVLGELIGSCVNLIRIRAQEKALAFHVERAEYLPKVLYGDVVRVRQIISNLLTNAVKYTREGSVTLFVEWRQLSGESGEIIVKVKDTGIGIKPENINDLFTSFRRLDEKKNRNIEGTGLGLSITKQLVELMGGSIEVESEYGKGSVFTVRIPQIVIESGNMESFEVSQESQTHTEETELHTRNARILVVDDVAMNLQVVKGLLKNTGVKIDMAERGMEALEMMRKTAYDIVFLDHMMPELDGVETLRILKQENPDIYEKTPIIMLTANAVLGVEEQYRKEGFAGYISKPVDREMLYQCMLKHLPKEKIDTGWTAESSADVAEAEKSTETGKAKAAGSEDPFVVLKRRMPEYDLDMALKYCSGVKEFLIEMLQEYVKSSFAERLKEPFEAEDAENYRIVVHSLKSTSLTVGFTEISQKAKELEMAAKEGRMDYVKENHEAVVEQYRRAVACIEELF